MDYRNLGSSGLKVSTVGLGCNNFGRRCDAGLTREIVHAAFDEGINFFDTADVYGPGGLSEEFLGKAIKGLDRSQFIIATKFANPMGRGGLNRGASRRYIFNAVEASLKRLDTDYIDLYQQHIPDDQTGIEETLRALDDLVTAGKVRYLGHSNFSGWQISDAEWTARTQASNRFVTSQSLYNLLDRRLEREIIPACKNYGIGILPYFPLASGMLTGKYQRGLSPGEGTRLSAMGERAASAMTESVFDVVEALQSFASAHGHTMLELAMSWLASKDFISSVISGATSVAQVKQNSAATNWLLSSDELQAIDDITGR